MIKKTLTEAEAVAEMERVTKMFDERGVEFEPMTIDAADVERNQAPATIRFMKAADPHSLNIMRGGKDWTGEDLGFIQWHPGRPPRMVIMGPITEIALSELRQIIERLQDEHSRSTS